MPPPQLRPAGAEQGRENMFVELNVTIWKGMIGVEFSTTLIRPRWNPWNNQFAVGLQVEFAFITVSVSWDK